MGGVADANVILERIPRLEYTLDQFLARLIVRMGLAGVNDLQAASLGRNPAHPIQVAEEKVRALVSRRPPREPECQQVRIQPGIGLAVDELNQLPLGRRVGLPYFRRRNPEGVTEAEVVLAPAGNAAVKQGLKRRAGPGCGVDAGW